MLTFSVVFLLSFVFRHRQTPQKARYKNCTTLFLCAVLRLLGTEIEEAKIYKRVAEFKKIRKMKTQKSPNAMVTLIVGICSLIFGYFLIGVVLGIIGVVMANKGMAAYRLSPTIYTNVGMLRIGKVLLILGIVFGSIVFLWFIL